MDLYIALALIGIVAGLVKGISGFGSSLVTIPLALWLTDIAVDDLVIMLITFNVILNTMLIIENKAFKLDSLKSVWVITLTGAIFSIVGLELLQSLDDTFVKYIAIVLISLAVLVKTMSLIDKKISVKESYLLQGVVGTLSGLGNGIASVDGPPVVFYISGIGAEKTKFKSILATHFLIMGVIAVIYSIIDARYTSEILLNTGYLTIFTVGGLVAGMLLSRKLDERRFTFVVLIILIGLIISMAFNI